ncbi:olfactory receptor 52E4-like [Lissotriton helveticus]
MCNFLVTTLNPEIIMLPFNYTGFTPPSFILLGFPGLEAIHIWFAPPLLVMYMVTLLGNSTLLLAIKTVETLHKPMYLLISFLSCSDLVLSSCILPKMLGIFLFSAGEISFSACFFQMFLIHVFAGVESGILTAMAFDRFVAVCIPLRYTALLPNSTIVKMAIVCLGRPALIVIPLLLLAIRLTFCSRYVPHSFCEHIAVAKLSCNDITLNSAYGLAITLSVGCVDLPCIALSYFQILRTVLRFPKRADRVKAFSTCTAHVSVMSLFYIPLTFSLAMHRALNASIPLYVHIIVVNCYLLLPPVANPLIYGVNMKEIRMGMLKTFQKGRDILQLT